MMMTTATTKPVAAAIPMAMPNHFHGLKPEEIYDIKPDLLEHVAILLRKSTEKNIHSLVHLLICSFIRLLAQHTQCVIHTQARTHTYKIDVSVFILRNLRDCRS